MMQILQFLRTELAAKPGRLEYVLRITVLTLLVVIISETFQIPMPAYSAYIVFFISKEESASTVLTGIIIAISTTIAVFLALAIYTISAGEPGLRLPLMAFIVFVGMFISRASPLGTAAFIIGFLLTISLTLIDFIKPNDSMPTAEILTRSVLWLWVVVMLPVSIVTIGNIFTGRNPIDLFNQGIIERLGLVGRMLTEPNGNLNDRKQMLAYAEEGMSDLLRYIKMSGIFSRKFLKKKDNEEVAAQTGRLIMLLIEWMDLKVSEPKLVDAASECGTLLLSFVQSLKAKKKIPLSYQKLALSPYEGATVSERKAFLLLVTIIKLVEELPLLLGPRSEAIPPAHSIELTEKKARQLLAPDAFTNPEYYRYALKTTLAIFIAYITYNMLYWPGIRTCMITCFFVSLGSLGETAQKMTLRLAGAIIGGGIGLATVIFIMPYLTTITHLCLIVAVVTFFAGWVATSSERLSYAGMQIALAFFLSILVGYGPTIDMTEARDRVIGVILGNIIIFFIFSMVWPTSAVTQARLHLAAALEKLSQMFSMPSVALEEQTHKDALLFAFSDAISQVKRLASLEFFEPPHVQKKGITVNKALIDGVQALCGPAIVLDELPSVIPQSFMSNTDLITYYKLLKAWLFHVSEEVISGRLPILSLPKIDPFIESLEQASIEPSGRIWLHACLDWYHTLDERLHKLDMLIKQSVVTPSNILFNQAAREPT